MVWGGFSGSPFSISHIKWNTIPCCIWQALSTVVCSGHYALRMIVTNLNGSRRKASGWLYKLEAFQMRPNLRTCNTSGHGEDLATRMWWAATGKSKYDTEYSSNFLRTNLKPTGRNYRTWVKHFPHPQGSPTSERVLCGTGNRAGEAFVRDPGKGVLLCLG